MAVLIIRRNDAGLFITCPAVLKFLLKMNKKSKQVTDLPKLLSFLNTVVKSDMVKI